MHDFAITQKHVILLDSSLVVAPQASALLCTIQASKSSLTLYVARWPQCCCGARRHFVLCCTSQSPAHHCVLVMVAADTSAHNTSCGAH